MFPLRRQAVILGNDRPAIGQLTDRRLAGVDHGFNGEDHVGFQLNSGTGLAVVHDLWVFVESCADTVSTEFTHDRVAGFFGILLNGMADIAEMGTGSNLSDAEPEAFKSDLAKPFRLNRDFTNMKHAAGITVIALLDSGDVKIDDVAILQLPVAGNAMANLVIYRGAD